MYDFANTIFSMNVISLYFALWVTIDKGAPDILYSIFLSGSMLIAALTAPILGTLSDHVGKRKPFLITFTSISCIFTAIISMMNHLWAGLICFALANFGYQIADVFYNSLLPQVSKEGHTGRVSGYGVSLGYVGTIAGLLLVTPFVLKYGYRAAFIPTGFFFFLFALPCFLFVKERFKNRVVSFEKIGILKQTFTKLRHTLTHIKNYPALFTFLIAAFIALNAVNTVMVFMSVYIKKIVHFSDPALISFYIVSSTFAIIGSFVVGFITDKIGPKKTLSGVLLLWCVIMILAMVSFHQSMFWIIGPLAGISLGSTWTSARALVVQLSPQDMIGEVFGFYGLVGKSASIIGPLIWGLTVWAFGGLGLIKYRIAIFILLLFLGLGLMILQKL